jgi:arylsulfatase A-like enzyme
VRRRPLLAAVLAGALLATVAVAAPPAPGRVDLPPNVVVVVTDDQTVASLEGTPVAMPWLLAHVDDPGWWSFSDAVVSTPVCCPSRATILTGRDAWATGVVDNATGERLDATDTLATRLQAAGYRTALVGKYLNGYPWGRDPFVPPGWDRWFAKTNVAEATTYYDYAVVDETRWVVHGGAPQDHVVDVLAREATAFVRTAPTDRPFFLLFTPPAPHRPATPAPRDVPALAGAPAEALARWRVEERLALRSVDRALAAIWDTLAWRGDLDRTVVVVTSDNGFVYGEHGWVGKQVPWEPSIRVPLFVRLPGSAGGAIDGTTTNADLAPTILALAGVGPLAGSGGVSLLPALTGGAMPADRVVLLGSAGADVASAWTAVRTGGWKLIRWDDGREQLFDLGADPDERHDLAGDPSAAEVHARLAALLPPPLVRAEDPG